MQIALYLAALLTLFIGVVHSVLGERYILIRLFRRDNLPKLFGGTEFTTKTLRFAWHMTSVAWCGLGAVLVLLAHPPFTAQAIGLTVAATFLVTGLVALVASRGRHLSWIVFFAIALLAFWATRV